MSCTVAAGRKSKSRSGFQGSTFPNSLVTVGGSGLGLMAMLAAYVGTLLLLGMTLTVGETLMNRGEACTFVGDALSPAAYIQLAQTCRALQQRV